MALEREPRSDWQTRLGDVVESRRLKVTLAVLIVISVLPGGYDQRYWYVFVGAFGVELLLRLALLWRRGRETSNLEIVFFAVDLLAFLSFLPVHHWLGFATIPDWLIVLRLTRLLVLLRFARELARDVYSILTRREQLQQFGLVTAAVLVLAFVAATVLYQLDVRHDYDADGAPDRDFIHQMWWSFRQLESPDNLVPTLEVTPLVAIVSLGLTIVGV